MGEIEAFLWIFLVCWQHLGRSPAVLSCLPQDQSMDRAWVSAEELGWCQMMPFSDPEVV